MPQILFVEQFYYPDGWGGAELPQALTMYLASGGYGVTVICGNDQYVTVTEKEQAKKNPIDAGVRILRIPSLFRGRTKKFKLLRQLWFCTLFLPLALAQRRPDLYVTQTNPPLILVLVRIAARIHNRKYVIIAQDLYPEMLAYYGVVRNGKLPYRVLDRLFRKAYCGASKIVALGPKMCNRIVDKGVSSDAVVEISNWATGNINIDRSPRNPLRQAWHLESKFVFLYSGNLGIGHEFDTLIHGFRVAYSEDNRLSLVFVGAGNRLDEVRSKVDQTELSQCISFHDFVPSDQLKYTMGLADVAVVTMNAGAEGLIVPSKAIGYMARGLPLLYIGPESDISCLILDAEAGFVVANGDNQGAALAMRTLVRDPAARTRLGDNAKAYYFDNLDKNRGLRKYQQLFETIVD